MKRNSSIKKPSTNTRERAWKEKITADRASHQAFLDAAAKREQFLAELSAMLKAAGVDLPGLLEAHAKAILSSPDSPQ